MDWANFGTFVLAEMVESLTDVVFVAMLALLAGVGSLVRDKRREVDASATASAGYAALAYLNEVVSSVVAKTEQTVMHDLREAKADGKITAEEFKELASNAGKAALDEVKTAALSKIMSAFALGEPEATKMLVSKIEAEVPKAKAAQLAAHPTEPAKTPA